MDFLNFVTDDYDMSVPAVAISSPNKKENFREIFCVNEVAKEDFHKVYYGNDPLLLIPGKQVVGKGLRSGLKQCIVTIRKKDACFIFNNGEELGDEAAQSLDDNCMLIFLGDAEEAFILLPNNDDSGQQLFRLENDVEIGVFLETELYHRRNGYYLCLLKDTACGMNMCSVTADSRTAEFMFRLFISLCG